MTLHLLFEDVVLVRAHQGFRTLAARRCADGARVTLVAPQRFEEPNIVRRALERAADAHARIEHPAVPRTVKLHEFDGRPVLELDAPIVADGLEIARRLTASNARLPYEAADAYIVGIRLALEAAHRVTDPVLGGPMCIGRLSAANVLFSADGRWFVLGFGHNVSIEDAHGVPDPTIPWVSAPEVMLGHPATPEGDYAALIQLMRTGIVMVDKTDTLGRILSGLRSNSDKALVELVQWFDRRVISEHPHARPTIAEAVAQSDRIRAILGVTPDPRGTAAVVTRLLMDPKISEPLRLHHGMSVLTLGEGEWVQWNAEEPVRLRGPMRRMLVALAEKQQLGSPSPMRASDFIDIGWPDETPSHESVLNRIYVTLNRLKKALPEGLIERFDDGYRLRPGVLVRRDSVG